MQHLFGAPQVNGCDASMDPPVEVVKVAHRLVGKVVALEVPPVSFDVVQFGGVLREPLDLEPGALGESTC